MLAAAVISVALPLADRYEITVVQDGNPPDGKADAWCSGVLAAALVALVTAALVSGFTDRPPQPQTGALPGLTGFLAVLLLVQATLFLVLMVSVAALAREARMALARRVQAAERGSVASLGLAADFPPYLGGNLATLVTLLGLALGGLLSAVINIGGARLLGAPVPSGFTFGTLPSDALAVPWPEYALAAAPVGLLLGGILAALWLWFRYRDRCNQFGQRRGEKGSCVAAAYLRLTAGPPRHTIKDLKGDDSQYNRNRGAIAKAWAIGLIADDAGWGTVLAVGGSLLLILGAELFAATDAGTAGHLALLDGWVGSLASVVALVAILVSGWLVGLLRQAYSDSAKRKTIGALWDVGTLRTLGRPPARPALLRRAGRAGGRRPDPVADRAYHPRAGRRGLPAHPGRAAGPAPPGRAAGPRAHRPVYRAAWPAAPDQFQPENGRTPAVIAQLPEEVLRQVAQLALGLPRPPRLYRAGHCLPTPRPGRSLPSSPGYSTPRPQPMNGRLDHPPGRWKNLRRRSDWIGSWVFTEPEPRLSDADLQHNVDQPCWDPVILVPDLNPTPPATHRHSQWWQDPRTNELGDHLVRILRDL